MLPACYPGLQPKSPRTFTITEVFKKNRIQESPSHPPSPSPPNLCKSFQIELEGFKVFYHCPISSSPTLPSSPTSQWRVSACPAALFPHAAAPRQLQITRQTQSYLIRTAVKFLTYTYRFAWFKHFDIWPYIRSLPRLSVNIPGCLFVIYQSAVLPI